MGYTIDIDTGGTFTDGFFVNGGDVRTVKVSTTPHDLTICFLECIRAGAKAYGVSLEDLLFDTDIIRFSNTIGTNTIIQRNGAKIGLLLSGNLADFAPTIDAHGKEPLVAPDMALTLDSRITASGQIEAEPAPEDILRAAQTLIDRGARGLVVCFENSEFNPAAERRIRAVIKREYPRDYLGSVPVFLASDISSHSGARERLNSAVLNAYIHAKLARLLYKAGEDLRQRQFRRTLFIGHNNGAVARVSKTRAINTYNSGPAAGLLGAREIGNLYGIKNLISTDMGGTSFDIGYVRDGQVSYALNPDVEGFPCNLPMMEIQALGTGGGSIARVEDGVLYVGPQSAGALPGPACFNLGGNKPTVTDANLILGVLDPDFFLGGTMKLDVAKARAAIEVHVATPLGISVEEAAWRMKQVVDRDMGSAIAKVGDELGTTERVVVAYGGAGGLHACDIAASAGAARTIMTPFAAVSSAYSSSLMDAGHLYYRRVDLALEKAMKLEPVNAAVAEMWKEARRDMRSEGFDEDVLSGELQLFAAAEGGDHNVLIHAPETVFDTPGNIDGLVAEARGLLQATGPIILGTVALMVRAPIPHYVLPEIPEGNKDAGRARKGQRRLFASLEAGYVDAPIYDRARLGRGAVVAGPALVESDQTTILVSMGWKMSIDKFNNAVLEEA
jgi:N-methylhydantoinase A